MLKYTRVNIEQSANVALGKWLVWTIIWINIDEYNVLFLRISIWYFLVSHRLQKLIDHVVLEKSLKLLGRNGCLSPLK